MIIAVCQEPSPPKTFQVLYTVVVVLLSLSVQGTSGYKTLQAGAGTNKSNTTTNSSETKNPKATAKETEQSYSEAVGAVAPTANTL